MKFVNPFLVSGYEAPDYFCDREQETQTILSAVKNQRNLTLISLRRMGKTGLIHHAFNKLSKEKYILPIYVDIMPTTDLSDFIKELSKGILAASRENTTILGKVIQILSHLRPKISYDSLTGQPAIELDVSNAQETENTLEGLFEYLNNLDKNVILAIDEFQQINQYPEKNIEATLRKTIQNNRHVNLLYSGSQRSVLYAMFQNQNRPFYQSTQILTLNAINRDSYHAFITDKFVAEGKTISEEIVNLVLDWTNIHTYYVQYFCNRLFSQPAKKIGHEHFQKVATSILEENAVIYNNYRALLTRQQFKLLKAIAKEKIIEKPTSKEFLINYKLGAASTARTTLTALIKKDIVTQSESGYFIQDVFFSRWLATI